MKTTIELPDALAANARAFARERGVTLRDLVVEGLRRELERRGERAPQVDFVFATADGEGLREEVAPESVVSLSYGLPR